MNQPIITQIASNLYSNISYSICINSFTPDSGGLNHTLLRHNVSISCMIRVADAILNDYEYAIITLAYKHVKTKAKRYKSLLKTQQASNVLYRDKLETLIQAYKSKLQTEPYCESKGLLLNHIASKIDSKLGDMGIQCMFRFQRFDGSSDFFLAPGSPISNLVSVIGLSVFEAQSIQEVLDAIILDFSNLFNQYILPKTFLDTSTNLDTDIKRYLYFCFYGE